jgi:hypothetical protein
MTARRETVILGANLKKVVAAREKVGAEMENAGLISAVGIGMIVSLSALVLVWAVVAAGLRRVAKDNALAERQSRVQSSKADA